MNYEEKYKQALERARNLMTNQNPPAFDKHLIEMVFPELKESEDERIRKAIIDYLKTHYEGSTIGYGVQVKEVIAWLEKQGEKTHAKLGQSEVTKTSEQELSDKIEPKKGGEE